MVGTGAHRRQACCIINGFANSKRFKRNQSLVVIHGKHGIKFFVGAARKKSIGTIRTINNHILRFGFFDSRFDDGFFFTAYQSFVAGMWI